MLTAHHLSKTYGIQPVLQDVSFSLSAGEHDRPYHAYAILTMCRSLYALEHGKIISKPEAAKWAQGQLDSKWAQVIEQALAERIGQGNFDLYEESLELIQHIIDKTDSYLRQTSDRPVVE